MAKDFDAVEWMRQRRAEIDDEDRGLTWREKNRKTLDLLRNDPLWQRLQPRPLSTPGVATRHRT